MGNNTASKLYRTFVKGLITEASYLTYPEDSSLDEKNTIPSRKGNRVRRFGMNYGIGNATARGYLSNTAKSEYMWNAVNRDSTKNFLVIQDGNKISFYDRSLSAFAANIKSFSINLADYTRPSVIDPSFTWCHFASGKGFLFIVGKDIEPLIVTYDPVSDNILVTKIIILARDFEGLQDGLANDVEPLTLSTNHFYNLLNQGWVNPTSPTVAG